MIIETFINNCKNKKEKQCMICENGDSYTWNDYLINVIKIVGSLSKMNLTKKSLILIHSNNNPKYFFTIMACLYYNIKFILINPDIKNKTILKTIVNKLKINIVFTDNIHLWINIEFKLKLIIINFIFNTNKNLKKHNKKNYCIEWNSFLNIGLNIFIEPIILNNNYTILFIIKEDNLKKINKKNLIPIKYKQLNYVLNVYKNQLGNINGNMISYLPLNLLNVLIFDVFLHCLYKNTIYFCSSNIRFQSKNLINELIRIKPLIFYGTPYIWNELYYYIKKEIDNYKTFFFLKIFLQFIKFINFNHYKYLEESKNNNILLIYYFFHFFIYFINIKIKSLYGFDKCMHFINFNDNIKKETIYFFSSIDIPIIQNYGSLESCGLISLGNINTIYNHGFPIIQLKITDKNEILIKGQNINNKNWINTNDCGILMQNGTIEFYGKNTNKNNKFSLIEYYFLKNIHYLDYLFIKKDKKNKKFINLILIFNTQNKKNNIYSIANEINKFNFFWKHFNYQINEYKIINSFNINISNLVDNYGKINRKKKNKLFKLFF